MFALGLRGLLSVCDGARFVRDSCMRVCSSVCSRDSVVRKVIWYLGFRVWVRVRVVSVFECGGARQLVGGRVFVCSVSAWCRVVGLSAGVLLSMG